MFATVNLNLDRESPRQRVIFGASPGTPAVIWALAFCALSALYRALVR
jgi:hypothetical protein